MRSALIEKNAKKEQEYPFLGVSISNTVVLFSSPTHGMVIRAGNCSKPPLGEYSDKWPMGRFFPFEGAVLLEN